ncbi:hypothetical protein R6Q57_003644 [Mikania cordata]
MIDVHCRRKKKIGLGFTEVKPAFNPNYSMMPNTNTSVDNLLMKSDRRCDFTTGSNKPIPLTADPVVTDPNISDDSEVCADSLSDTGGDDSSSFKVVSKLQPPNLELPSGLQWWNMVVTKVKG